MNNPLAQISPPTEAAKDWQACLTRLEKNLETIWDTEGASEQLLSYSPTELPKEAWQIFLQQEVAPALGPKFVVNLILIDSSMSIQSYRSQNLGLITEK